MKTALNQAEKRTTRSSSAVIAPSVAADSIAPNNLEKARSTSNTPPASSEQTLPAETINRKSSIQNKFQERSHQENDSNKPAAYEECNEPKSAAVRQGQMLTRGRQLVRINPPERFRDAKAIQKLRQKCDELVPVTFKKPRGRPSRASQALKLALAKPQPVAMIGYKRVKKQALELTASDQKVHLNRRAKLVAEVSEFENQIKSSARKISDQVLNPEELQHRPTANDVVMTEEQELKLIVKNVAKKLTYDEEEKFEYNPQGQMHKAGHSHNNFDIIISEDSDSDDYQNQMKSHIDSVQSAAYGDEDEQVEDRTLTEEFESEHISNVTQSRKPSASFGQRLQEKLRNLNLSSSVSKLCNVTLLQAILKRQHDNPHLYKVGPTKYQDGSTKGHWTQQEDLILTDAVSRNNQKNWKKIAEDLPGRTDVQCLHRWQKVLNPCLVKGPWTEEEDRMVLTLVQEKGAQKWTQIAEHLDGRIGKQCRERWHNHLNPMIKKNPWSREEEWILYICHRQYGNQWAEIAQFLSGRTDNTIKNHWNSSMRKKLFDFKRELETQAKKQCADLKIDFYGVSLDQMKSYPFAFRQAIKQLEDKIQAKNQEAVRQQNKIYYELKARELLEKRDQDYISFAMAKMLLKNLNKKIEDFLPSPSKGQTMHHKRSNQSGTTAPNTTVRQRSNQTKSNLGTDCFRSLNDDCNGVHVQPFQIPTSESNFKSKSSARPSAQRRHPTGKENRNIQQSQQAARSGSSRGRGRPSSNTHIHQTDTEADNDLMTVENDPKQSHQPAYGVQKSSPDTPNFEKHHQLYPHNYHPHAQVQHYYRHQNYNMIPPYLPVMPDHNTHNEDKAYQVGNFFDYGDDYNRILEDIAQVPPPLSLQYSLSFNPNINSVQYGNLSLKQQRMLQNGLLETPPNNFSNQDVAVFGNSSSSAKHMLNKYNSNYVMHGGMQQNMQSRIGLCRGGVQMSNSGNSNKNCTGSYVGKSPQPFQIAPNESPEAINQFLVQRKAIHPGFLRQSPQSNGMFQRHSPYQMLKQGQFQLSPAENNFNPYNKSSANPVLGAKVAPVQLLIAQQKRDSAFKPVITTPSRSGNESNFNTSKQAPLHQSVCKFSMLQMNSASSKKQ